MSGASARWQAAISDREQLLGRDTVKRMSELFLEEVSTLLETASQSLAAGDFETARRTIHHLCGSAGTLDFVDLAEAAQLAERACLSADPADAQAKVHETARIALRCVQDLQQRFGTS